MEGTGNTERNDLYSKSIRAGKRTYFFDVKSTKANEYYLTLTESKKRFLDDGKFTFEKHKIFLYKEDFEKFVDALNEAVAYINENSPVVETAVESGYSTDVSFEDLDK